MTPEERIRSKVAGLRQAQMERDSESLRNQYDISVGEGGEAFKTRAGEIVMDDQGRAYRMPGEYVYSDDDLQRAMDMRNSNNRVSNAIFDQVLRSTGNPTMAADAVNVANYTPGVGTVIGGQEAYDALTEIPDGYREGDYMDMAKNAGMAGMGIMDAVLTMAPFAKGIMKGARNLPKAMRNAGDATSRGIDAMDNFMAPRPPRANQNVLFDQVVKYLESRGQ